MVSMHSSPVASPGAGDAGAMNVAVRATALELARRDVQVDLLTRAVGEPRSQRLADGVVLHELSAGPRGQLSRERLGEATDEFGEAVAAFSRSQKPDLIHAHYWRSGIATLPVALELGLPFVQSFHSLGAMRNSALGDASEPELRVRSETYLANQADAVIAASATEVSSLIDQVGAPAGRVWVVPPGVDAELFSPARAIAESVVRGHLGIDAERPIIVMAGRVQPLKAQELAVQAIASIEGERPVLVIAGEVQPGAERYAEQVQLAAGNDVLFVGALEREELADLFAAAALTLLPSRSETFGLVALESAASGTPVIAFRAGGLSESVVEGVSGLLLGTRDPRYWATEMALLIENDERRAALGIPARAHAERFTWAAAATSLLGIYASVRR